MIGRLAGLRGQLSSRWLASAFVIAYLVVSVTVGISLLTAPKAVGGAGQAPGTPGEYPDPPPTTTNPTLPATPRSSAGSTIEGPPSSPAPPATTTTTPAPLLTAPAGFKRVSGPRGMRTVIPQAWRSQRSSGGEAMRASDPADAGRYVKYGGSPAPEISIEPVHVRYENWFAERAADYRRIALTSADYAGHEAVEWEFEHRTAGSYQRVRSLYWRAGDTEYFVLAAAPADGWTAMKPIYDTMVAHASP